MARRKKGGMVALGGSMRKDRRRKGGGLERWSGFGRKKGGRSSGLVGALGLGSRMFGSSRRRGGIVADVARSLRERVTPVERDVLRREVDEAIEADQQLQGERNDAMMSNRERLINRLVAAVRERLRKPVL